MDFPDFVPPRVVTHTYKRKRGRGPRLQHHTLVPSPLRNGMSINLYTSDEEETIEKISATPPRRKTSQSTPPSTPGKRKGGSQSSSPKKAPSSPSKVSLDREIGKIYTLKSLKTGGMKAIPSDDDDDDDQDVAESLSSETAREALLLSPRKPSFADRMAPKKAKKTDLADAAEDVDAVIVCVGAESQLSESLSSPSSSQEGEDGISTMAMPSVRLQASSQRTFQRVRSTSEIDILQQPPVTMLMNDLEKAKPCLIEMSKRWDELDDLDGEEEEEDKPAINNITGLRGRGQKRRFQEEYQYLVLELDPLQSVADRRSTCVELAKKVLTWDDDTENAEVGDSSTKRSDGAIHLTPFLSQVKTADLTGQLWSQLRLSGAGSGKDKVLDLALILICLGIVRSDITLLSALSSQKDFNSSMTTILESKYENISAPKDMKRHLRTLSRLAKSCSLALQDGKVEISSFVLKLVWMLVDATALLNNEPFLHISQINNGSNSSILDQLWRWIAREAKAAKERDSPDDHAIDLISHIITICIPQVNTSQHLKASASDLATLFCHYTRSATPDVQQDSETNESHLDTLSSLLRMILALISLEDSDWDTEFMIADGMLDYVVEFTIKSASQLIQLKQEQDQTRLMTPFSLCLALLTDFLTKDAPRTRQCLFSAETDEGKSKIGTLAQLFQHHREKSEADASSGFLTGSLALVLALLIVGSKETTGKSSEQKENLAIKYIKSGLHDSDTHNSILLIRDCLVDFSDMIELASRTKHNLVQHHPEKAKEEEKFFAALSESLSLLLESQSSSSL